MLVIDSIGTGISCIVGKKVHQLRPCMHKKCPENNVDFLFFALASFFLFLLTSLSILNLKMSCPRSTRENPQTGLLLKNINT